VSVKYRRFHLPRDFFEVRPRPYVEGPFSSQPDLITAGALNRCACSRRVHILVLTMQLEFLDSVSGA
jgi:hypothetical protein